jgi:phage replication O-like protein O
MSKENIFFPNTTQVPNFVFDVLMAKCGKTPTRFFVLLAIIRKTYGWQKHEDLLSLSQIIELTGMSKNAVKDALKFWQKEKVIKLLSKGDGRKISKYRCLLYDYIDTQGVIQKHSGGQSMIPTESTSDTYRGQSVTPQNQENNNQKQLTKENLPLPTQLKEFAKQNNLVYEINVDEDRKIQSKLVSQLSITNEQIVKQIERLKPILKDSNCDWWSKTNSFGFNFLLKNWGRIDAWHNANKPQVREFKKPEKPAPTKFSNNDLDSLKEFLA